ncbi:MAG: hypothetical protein R3F16_02905 [Myxococcota bacterium]
MPEKSVPLSVRISVDDAEFIARLSLEGATTPSEKMRKLLGEARRRREDAADYGRCLGMVRESLDPAIRALRELEHAEGMHSELALGTAEWLPEMIAFVVSTLLTRSEEDHAELLRRVEAGMADRIFRLLETTLRLGVTPESPTYSPTLVSDRLDRLLSLVEVIRRARPI